MGYQKQLEGILKRYMLEKVFEQAGSMFTGMFNTVFVKEMQRDRIRVTFACIIRPKIKETFWYQVKQFLIVVANMKMRHIFLLLLLLPAGLFAQQGGTRDTLQNRGAWARMEVQNGDTTFVMSLWTVKISERRVFKDRDEQIQYNRYKNAARKVYGYALQAIDMYQTVEQETQDMGKRQRRRYLRHEHKEIKEDFNEQLKKLSRTEGKVLIKMIEKEVGKPFYEIIKETRGGMTAAYWHNMSKFWGYDLKDGYTKGADPLLDEIFLDYDFGRPDWYLYQ